ncbi:MAG: hypothetical protein K2O91_25385 [Lachnospiraceae bacterium]|nr:hypothetical protein [Lachnospiraceae bacterium]
MTYEELEVNTEIAIKEKSHEEQRTHKTVRYTVIKKYPGMCIVMDKRGRRRGIAIGELIMNKIITQEPYFESLRNEHIKASKGWHKKDSGVAGECAP